MTQELRVGGKFAKKTLNDRHCWMKALNSGPSRSSNNPSTDLNNNAVASTSSEPASPDQSCTSPPPLESWKIGRRIIELEHIAKQMNCTDCGKTLHLKQIVHEKRLGFGSTLMIECECGITNEVTTGKTHRVGKRGPAVFDVNTKAALGMLHSGSGHTQISSFMSTLEIDGLHHTTMKKREMEVEPHILNVAQQSCQDAITAEVVVHKNAISPGLDTAEAFEDSSVKVTPCEFKYDMGWQKRGSGRAYDSKSGVGTMIGNRTGKICAYGVRNKDCRKCTYHVNRDELPPEHDCPKNWYGSSKSMEADVAVHAIQNIEKSTENVKVNILIMDDDCTTMAKVKKDIPHAVTKWSDINHTRKHLGSSLYALQKQHKSLSPKYIQFFQKCYGYAVAQNKGDPKGLEKALNAIVPHAYGEHEKCDSRWCGYHKHPNTYKHKTLPYGRNFSGQELRNDLNNIFDTLVQNVDKISPHASTRDVESFNNIVASKAPKRCHYSASSSLHNRVSCSVAEKNLGSTYVNKVNESAGLSPGRISAKHAERKNQTRKRRVHYENTREFKKRRLENKLSKRVLNSQRELREGVTYSSAVALSNIEGSDTSEIPGPKMPPSIEQVQNPDTYCPVYCDIETTSLHKSCDIVQIAAISGKDAFSQYILPSKSIARGASNVTGLSLHGNVLFYHGNPVNTVSLKEALSLLLSWLDKRKPCLLLGHNFKTFDLPRIIRAFNLCELLPSLADCVVGIIDTLPLCREFFPNLKAHSQEHLLNEVLHEHYAAHNAVEDIASLQRLMVHVKPPMDMLVNHSLMLTSAVKLYNFDTDSDENLATLSQAHVSKVITKLTASKIAKSGLRLAHLRLAIQRGGLDGLSKLLSEKVQGKPRVTASIRIVNKLFEFLSPRAFLNG